MAAHQIIRHEQQEIVSPTENAQTVDLPFMGLYAGIEEVGQCTLCAARNYEADLAGLALILAP